MRTATGIDGSRRWGARGIPAIWMAVFSLLGHGCAGSIDPGADVTSGGPGGGKAPAPGSNTFAPPPGCEASATPAHLVVHRLNRVEYNNTVRDLLGDTSNPADEFSPDSGDGTFDNNSSNLIVNQGRLQEYQRATSRMAQSAVGKPGFVPPGCRSKGDLPCARQVLEPFATRAWRRPVTAMEVDGLAAFVQKMEADGNDFAAAMALAVQRVLLSPHFLYRVEYPPSAGGTAPYSLDAYALASRLSYFLWSSMPDDELRAVAGSGKLANDDELGAQVTRMLADPKASVLGDTLAGQWLRGRAALDAQPLPIKFPQFDASLRASIPQEPALFLEAFLEGNLDLRGLMVSDFTFLNDRLARHYGIPGVTGSQFRRVSLNQNAQRGGILTQAGLLIATSKESEPSIPKRGVWVLQSLLCTPIPPPPPDAMSRQAALEKSLGSGPTRRQVTEARDALAGCGDCHRNFDPFGLALEKYDATGAWRETDDQKRRIDATGQIDGLGDFNGPRQMSRLLAEDARLPACLVTTLFRYALGRLVTGGDRCMLDHVTKTALTDGFRAQDVIAALVKSPAFKFQGAVDPTAP